MSYFYEIRSTTDTVLKRDGGFASRVAQPLNFRVADPSRFIEGSEGLVLPSFSLNRMDRVNADQAVFWVRVE